MIELTTTCKS